MIYGKYIMKKHYFKSGRSIHFTYRSGINAERMIGFKLQNHRCDKFWSLWIFLHWIDLGFSFCYEKKKEAK